MENISRYIHIEIATKIKTNIWADVGDKVSLEEKQLWVYIWGGISKKILPVKQPIYESIELIWNGKH